jgi:hypothetical protein
VKNDIIYEMPTHAVDIRDIDILCPKSINGRRKYLVNFLSERPCKSDGICKE